MKKLLYLLSTLIFSASLLSGCSSKENGLTFSQDEYSIYSGDKVVVKQHSKDVVYSFLGKVPDNVSLNENSGVITYSEDVPNYSQVLYQAKKGELVSNPVIINLLQVIPTPTITFVEISDYLCDGDYVIANSSTNSSITYSLKETYRGISIDSSNGMISYTHAAEENLSFEVVASSNGASASKVFKVAKTHLAKTLTEKQVSEDNATQSLIYFLDFSDVNSTEFPHTVLRILKNRKEISAEQYTYNAETHQLSIRASLVNECNVGENTLTVVTPRNNIYLNLIKATKIVKTAEDLASINKDEVSLGGYYVLGNDIDLTTYLSEGGAGYNDGKGWTPIGTYHDVLDGTAYNFAFKGTFDGNGYTISGLYINRHDEQGFNSGLFGYVHNLAVIKNLGVIGLTQSNVCSFAGGFVGVSEGEITNCWANVNISNNIGGNTYHMIGGFIGRNLGVVENCYAIGKVDGEGDDTGAFVGFNEGRMSNCYAISTVWPVLSTGIDGDHCKLYDSLAEFIADSYNLNFSEEAWNLSLEALPSLKPSIEFFYPYSLKISNETTDCTIGEDIEITYILLPDYLVTRYENMLVLTCDDLGVVVDGFTLITKDALSKSFKVRLSLTIDDVTLEDEKEFHLYDEIESLSIDSDFPMKVYAGHSYKLNATILPETANQKKVWTLTSDVGGVSIDGDILRVSDEIEAYNVYTFGVRVTASNKTKMKNVSVVQPKYLSYGMHVIYQGETNKDFVIEFPEKVNLTDAVVLCENEEISVDITEHVITIPQSIMEAKPDVELNFVVNLANGDYYRFSSVYLTHERIKESDVTNYIALSSAEDFKTYFNIQTHDPARYENYSKTFVLTDDIDFNGEEIYSIGVAGDNVVEYVFNGKIYGFGHTIKNAIINDNERYLTLTDAEKADNYRVSRYAVGFFSSFNGEIYDVTFENIKVTANSWNGCFAGTLRANAYLENITFKSCVILNGNDVSYSTKDGLRTGRFAAANEGGTLIACTYNGSRFGLIG